MLQSIGFCLSVLYYCKYFLTHMQYFEADEKGGKGCDVGVFFLLGSGVKVESLWHS